MGQESGPTGRTSRHRTGRGRGKTGAGQSRSHRALLFSTQIAARVCRCPVERWAGRYENNFGGTGRAVIYLDTSYLVRLYFEDTGFEAVRVLAASDHVACAQHGQAEAMAAFHRKYRERAVTLKSYRAMLAQFETDHQAGAIRWLPAGDQILQKIRDVYADLPASVYLRGADALHLATAAGQGLKVIYGNDSHLLAAAEYFELKGINVITKG